MNNKSGGGRVKNAVQLERCDSLILTKSSIIVSSNKRIVSVMFVHFDFTVCMCMLNNIATCYKINFE